MLDGMLYKQVSTVRQEAQSIYKVLDGNGGVGDLHYILEVLTFKGYRPLYFPQPEFHVIVYEG